MPPVRLERWSTGFSSRDAFQEFPALRLRGVAYGHPRKPDGSKVRSSPVVSSQDRLVTTESGTVYELVGDPDPAYVEYLASIGYPLDPQNPVKVRRSADAS